MARLFGEDMLGHIARSLFRASFGYQFSQAQITFPGGEQINLQADHTVPGGESMSKPDPFLPGCRWVLEDEPVRGTVWMVDDTVKKQAAVGSVAGGIAQETEDAEIDFL